MHEASLEDDADAFLAAFLQRRLADRQRGCEGTLDDYCRLFPGREEFVRRTWSAIEEDAGPTGPVSAIRPGGRLGNYRIVRRLGRGGQGEVWLGEDTRLGRQVAIKVLRGLAITTADALRRFRREAEVASRLDHPGICPVYDIGTEHDVPYLVMRFVDGRSLGEAIAEAASARRLATSAHLDWAAAVVERLAHAIQAAHAAGVLHRDLKPANVMLTRDGQPVLLDFGLAGLIESEAMFTRTDELHGTPAYIAPELLASTAAKANAGTDVYGLGLLLYECLAGQRPFDAPTRDGLYRQILTGAAVPVRQRNAAVPRDLAVIQQTAMQLEATRRYASATAVAEDLRRFRARQPILARRAGVALRLRRWFQRSPALAMAVFVLIATLVTGLTISLTLWQRADREHARAAGLLTEWQRLADRRRLDQLRAEADDSLWPAVPARVEAMDAWLRRADDLVARLPAHRRTLQELPQAGGRDDAPVFADDETAWRYGQLRELVHQLEEFARDDPFATTVASVRQRRALALELHERTIASQTDAWAAVAARVREGGRHAGIALSPQLGLVPLGPDPDSGLEEFALVASGDVPARGTDGRLVRGERTALVFVLLPGATAWIGSQDQAPSLPNYDPLSRLVERPVHRVEIRAFLLSKFEMTQGQWLRVTGVNPSTAKPGDRQRGHIVDLCHPVESVNWDECRSVLRQLGLVLPTEAQWEHACRCGRGSPWSTGETVASLAGHANIGDEASRGSYPSDWMFEPGFDDGHAGHAPVGSLLANCFGLHDMHGNVREWCADRMGRYRSAGVGGTEPVVLDTVRAMVVRGGSFQAPARFARSAFRDVEQAETRFSFLGVRPARLLDP